MYNSLCSMYDSLLGVCMRLRFSVYIESQVAADISLKTSYPYTYGRVVIGIIDMRIN